MSQWDSNSWSSSWRDSGGGGGGWDSWNAGGGGGWSGGWDSWKAGGQSGDDAAAGWGSHSWNAGGAESHVDARYSSDDHGGSSALGGGAAAVDSWSHWNDGARAVATVGGEGAGHDWNSQQQGDGGGWGGDWGDAKDKTDWDDVGRNLELQRDWSKLQLVPISKNFYIEHPDVAAKSEAEVEKIRKCFDIEVLEGSPPKPVTTFQEAAFPDWLTHQLLTKPYKRPTAIQVQVWPAALEGRDLIGIAETGSGKTLAYVLPMLVHIVAQEELRAGEGPVGVVLCPTRELALQINGVVQEYAGDSGIMSTCIYGGTRVRDQGWALQEKNDVVVATPGRFIHLLNDGWTNLNRVTYVVLDEADAMLDLGFEKQVRLLLTQVRPDRQILMFSATWPTAVQDLAKEFCRQNEENKPVFIRVGGDRLAACRTIDQIVCVDNGGTTKEDTVQQAIERIDLGPEHKCLIFCRRKDGVDELVEWLEQRFTHVKIRGIHAGKSQEEREESMNAFKSGEVPMLVATNCLERGHDIPRVEYVINYDAPDSIESYIHRIGRTGRAGNKGYALTVLDSTKDKDARLAPALVEVLNETKQKVNPQLRELAQKMGPMSAGQAADQGLSGAWDGGGGDWSGGRGGSGGGSGDWSGGGGGEGDWSTAAGAGATDDRSIKWT